MHGPWASLKFVASQSLKAQSIPEYQQNVCFGFGGGGIAILTLRGFIKIFKFEIPTNVLWNLLSFISLLSLSFPLSSHLHPSPLKIETS